ncbi:MAG: hypothetical protein ACK5GN_09745 [Pseudomonadota bacterium]|jgi:hypothetical protein
MAAKKSQTETGKALLALGGRVVQALKASDPEVLALLEQYTDTFDSWQRSWSTREGAFPVKERELGERIAAQHDTVIELTEGMLSSVEQSLKELRGWSKGIRAYMDHFPRKVSTIRSRKG